MKYLFSVLVIFTSIIPGQGRASDLIGGEPPKLLSPEEAIKTFTLHPDYEINLYASEVDFPLHSPAAMTFDSQGRLWVGNIPTQPHAKPGEPIKDSVIILEDTDRDGAADKHTVFCEGLYLPLGLAVEDGGRTAFVTDEPNLVKLRDTDGDGTADEKTILLQGFGTEDNHHFISAFQWGPDGRLYYGQGLFLNSQVETPGGPVRAHQAAVFRHDPRVNELEVFASFGWSNVWGIIFDNKGQSFLADASPGLNYFLSHTTSNFKFPKETKYDNHRGRRDKVSFTPSGRRPTCGNELLLSDHFPEEVRGWYVTNQMKGWHGVRWYKLEESGSGVAASQPFGEENELLSTTDIMFRPVAMQIGPDGALYVLDYYNPIVGHTTYSFRDSRHIKTYGRVWRIKHKSRPLDWQPDILGEPVPALLANLGHSNYRARYHSRRELQQRKAGDVLPLLSEWIAGSENDDGRINRRMEALWLHQNFNQLNLPLLRDLLDSSDYHDRAAALRVLRHWQAEMDEDEVLKLLGKAVIDESQRVRLEALIGLSYYPDPEKALPVAALALDREMDEGFKNAAFDVFIYLNSQSDSEEEKVNSFLLPFLNDEMLLASEMNDDVAREILKRPGLDTEYHRKALNILAADGDAITYLVDQLGAASGDVPVALEKLLLSSSNAELKRHIDSIAALTGSGYPASIRTLAQAIVWRCGGSSKLESDTQLAQAVVKAGRGNPPEILYERFADLLASETVAPAVVNVIMPAVGAFPSKDRESLDLLASIADRHAEKNITLSFAALQAMKRIPRNSWPAEYGNRVLSSVTISATPNLKFTPEEFTVKAGSAVNLTFRNPDNLYHNLVVVKAGALEQVGLKADLMAGDPDGLDKDYVPDDPNVLHWTPQITLGIARSHRLQFFAPDEPGDYPYICTFPGHWRVMQGVMKVVE